MNSEVEEVEVEGEDEGEVIIKKGCLDLKANLIRKAGYSINH